MEQHSTHDDPPETAPRSPRLLRGVILVSIAMLALVALTQPAVRAQLDTGAAWLSGLIASSEDVAMADDESARQKRIIPRVTAMPQNRLPVHRGSVSRKR